MTQQTPQAKTTAAFASVGSPAAFTWREGWRYGWLGFGLAFVALPLYVVLPHYYANNFGVPLATLGALLLGARLMDALIDPLLGRWSDGLYRQSLRAVLGWGAVAAVALATGFVLLFFPQVQGANALPVWAGLSLVLTYTAYSALSILHQSWGAMLGGDEAMRARVVSWREGLGLLGVVTASLAPLALGMAGTSVVFAAALATGWWAWSTAMSGTRNAGAPHTQGLQALWLPLTRPAFRALLGVFLLNGIASAIPATLILFFVQDRLQAPPDMQALFLGVYFVSAALAIPVWLRCVARIGLARTWGLGMLLSIAVFVFAAQLGAGDSAAFMVVCALSGAALGTDLAVPAALLAGTMADNGDRGQAEGAYFGWWNFASKLNLALAAGLALPALQAWGYTPGAQDADALNALTFAYCLLPCALKLAAAALLYLLIIRKAP
jgi:GPH family glycoside/pentoside/hexuronide:cation symporter